MKKVSIVNNVNGLTFSAKFENDESMNAWIDKCKLKNSWGLPEMWVETPIEGAETKVENEKTLYKKVCEYTITITDLSTDYNYLLEQCYANRTAAYGSVGDQLDKIYHDGIDAWKAHIAAVKTQYPKPAQG